MSDLRTTFAAFRDENPKTRIRTAARELGVSEAELVATGVDGDVIRAGGADGGWRALLHEIEPFGEVMALTRNDACVHEKHGVYDNVSTDLPHKMALVLDDAHRPAPVLRPLGVRLRRRDSDGRTRRSLQFFDAHGDAVHKIFLTDKSDGARLRRVCRGDPRRADAVLEVTPRPAPKPDTPDTDLEVDAFLEGWAGLQDTHDFFPLLRDHGVGRTQALRLAEGRFTERAEPVAARRALEAAAETGTPIMVFVGNPGAIQIHSGPVEQPDGARPLVQRPRPDASTCTSTRRRSPTPGSSSSRPRTAT